MWCIETLRKLNTERAAYLAAQRRNELSQVRKTRERHEHQNGGQRKLSEKSAPSTDRGEGRRVVHPGLGCAEAPLQELPLEGRDYRDTRE